MPSSSDLREQFMFYWKASNLLPVCFLLGSIIPYSQSASAETESPPEIVSLEDLRAYAFSKSPLVASIDASFANNVGTAIETRQLQNPSLQGQIQYTESYSGMRPDDRYSVSLSQPIRLSDFGTRSAVGRLLRKAATQQQQYKLLELSQNILFHYINLWAFKRRKTFIQKMTFFANRQVFLAAEGKNKGFLSTSEVKLLQGAASRLKLLELGLDANISNVEATLSNLTGFALTKYKIRQPEFRAIPSLEEALRRSKANNIGIRRRVNLLAQVAKRQVELAKKDAFPGFIPSLLYEHEDNSDFIGFGISFELPFFDRNRGEIFRKQEKARELRVRKNYLDGSAFQSELGAILQNIELKYNQAKSYENEVFPLFREALEEAEKQFESGQTSVAQLWQAFLSFNDANEEQLILWVDAYGARSKLSLMLGEE